MEQKFEKEKQILKELYGEVLKSEEEQKEIPEAMKKVIQDKKILLSSGILTGVKVREMFKK